MRGPSGILVCTIVRIFLHIYELTGSHDRQMNRRPRLTPELEALGLFDEVEAGSDATTDTMRLLVELFYESTSSDPSDRPSAEYIYDKLIEVSKQPHAAQTENSSSSSSSSST